MSRRDMEMATVTSTRHPRLGDSRAARAARARRSAACTQEALGEIARATASHASPVEIARVAVDVVRRLLPADRSAVWTWRRENGSLDLLGAAPSEDGATMPAGGLPPPPPP